MPEPYWAHYRDKVPMPVIPEGFLDSLPLNYQHLRVDFHVENVPPELVKKGRELYDLQADPGEFHNLAGRSEQKALIEKLHGALVKELGEDPEVTERRCRADIATGYGEAPKGKRKGSAEE